MCNVMPPPPVVATPAPPPPAPVPPPPAPAPGNPPGPTPPAVMIELADSLVILTNGVQYTFAQAMALSGVLDTIASGQTAVFRTRVLLVNKTTNVSNATLTCYPEYSELSVSPSEVTPVNIPGSGSVWVEHQWTVSNGGGGTYAITFTVGGVSVTIRVGLSFLNP